MKKLGQILDKNIKSKFNNPKENSHYYALKKEISSFEGAFDFLKLIHNWEKIIGKQLAKHTIPIKNKKDTLTILTNHSAFSQQLSFMHEKIIEKIVAEFPKLKGKIKKLNFIVDSTHFQKQLEKIEVQKKSLGHQRLGHKEELDPTKKQFSSRFHKYSPEYRKLKTEAQKAFSKIDDGEMKELLTSLYIQTKD